MSKKNSSFSMSNCFVVVSHLKIVGEVLEFKT